MFNKFYNWITYNPNKISINSILPHIVTIYVVLVILLCFYVAMFKRITIKNIIFSMAFTPYLMFSILWLICFAAESEFIASIPTYLMVLYIVCKNGIRYIKNKNINKGTNRNSHT